MSLPANSLASYRSYSYYHVLAMCDCTDTADKLAKETSLDIWNHATGTSRVQNIPDLGLYSPKCVGGTGKYVILINGSTDAAFVITKANWATVTAGHAAPGDRGGSIVVEGSMTISEPKGVVFLDQIVQSSLALGVDASQVIYVLKTFIIGHLDEQGQVNQETIHITDIPPLNAIVYDVTGSFTEAGGSYEMQMVGVGHGAVRLPQYSKAVNSINITAGPDLKGAFAALEKNINDGYTSYFKCVTDQIKQTKEVDSSKLLEAIRPVKYVIEVSPVYQDPRYRVTDQPAQTKDVADCNAPAKVNFHQHTSIETAINTIMQLCPQVKEDMAKGSPENKIKYEYKIHTSLVSTPVGGTSTDLSGCSDTTVYDYTVYYRIEQFPTPKSIAFDSDFQTLQSGDADEKLKNNALYNELRSSIIQFDYIYTGKNIDILEFDMKVNNGLAYLQTATLANTLKSQLERVPNMQTHSPTGEVNNMAVRFGGKPVQTPLFFGKSVRTPQFFNSSNAKDTIETVYTLTKHASIESAEATMKITGNDQLLRFTNRSSSAEFVSTDSKAVFDVATTNTPANESFHKWSRVPLYAKVRIKMPRNNDDEALFTGQSISGNDSGQDYARDFWFDGYYYIYGIDHLFDDGQFTQTLHMIALPKKSAFDSAQSTKTKEIEINTAVGSCFDSNIGCSGSVIPTGDFARRDRGQTSVSQNSVEGERGTINPPFVRPQTDGTPTNLPDAKTVNAQGRTLSSVPGWNKASPEVKTAIINAANTYGVDPVTLAQVAAKESSLGKNLVPPKGTARGVFQFIESTWLGYVRKDPKIGVDTSLTRQQQLDARLDPQASANAGASYMADNARTIGSTQPGDLYLSHFIDGSVAKKIIAADKAGNGNTPLKDILTPKQFAGARRSNPTIITREDYTAGELRAFAAKSMNSSVSNSSSEITKTAVANAPISATALAPRIASQTVTAINDCAAQPDNKNKQVCGPTAQNPGKA
jgi:hypothetical protein